MYTEITVFVLGHFILPRLVDQRMKAGSEVRHDTEILPLVVTATAVVVQC